MIEGMDAVRRQYEQNPYPPLSQFAWPKPNQGQSLRYEYGRAHLPAKSAPPVDHRAIRILIAGAGTFEPLVVAQMHPEAKEVVAVDWSCASLRNLERRMLINGWRAGFRSAVWSRRPGHVRLVQADLQEWDGEGGQFDYILATNVLHHFSDPAAMLARLASWLAPGGMLRLVTYASHSRYWIGATARWLSMAGIHAESPRLRYVCRRAVQRLPSAHPVRSAFDSLREREHRVSLIDAYFHACDNPLPPLGWKRACDDCGLRLVGEGQDLFSRSSVLDTLVPRVQALSSWAKLQILDDLLELSASPVLWLHKDPDFSPGPDDYDVWRGISVARLSAASDRAGTMGARREDVLRAGREIALALDVEYQLPSQCYFDLRQGMERAQSLLNGVGVNVQFVINALGEEFGPRHTRNGRGTLAGLTLSEYDQCALRDAFEPWSDDQWLSCFSRFASAVRLVAPNQMKAPAVSLIEQARWMQAVFGPMMPMIPVRVCAA